GSAMAIRSCCDLWRSFYNLYSLSTPTVVARARRGRRGRLIQMKRIVRTGSGVVFALPSPFGGLFECIEVDMDSMKEALKSFSRTSLRGASLELL
ncbi:hypothetical protein HAX54_023424, partial [Datura stramonium]|nr:hypothetical protein [Datura stramonium]